MDVSDVVFYGFVMESNEKVRLAYNRIAARYDASAKTVRVAEREKYTSLLKSKLSPGARILDIGCGSGTLTGALPFFEVIGIDLSESQIDLAKKRYPDKVFRTADIASMDWPSSSFDGIAAFYSLFHIDRKDHARLFQNFRKWLKQGGIFAGSFLAADFEALTIDFLGERFVLSGYDPATNSRMLENAGFHIESQCEEVAIEDGETVPLNWVVALAV